MEANIETLLKRISLFLEDGDWAKADEYCEKVLDKDPENAEAYLGKLMAELHVRTREGLSELSSDFGENKNYQKALRYGDEALQTELKAAVAMARKAATGQKKRRLHIYIVAIFLLITILSALFLILQTLQRNKWLSNWQTITAGGFHSVGLMENGTVVAIGDNEYGQCNMSDWKGVVAIAAGDYHTVGLKADGTVVSTTIDVSGWNYGQCNVSGWKNIIAIAAGSEHTVGLKKDGTVVAAGYSDHGPCDVSKWRNIVSIAAGDYHTVGLKTDGTVVSTTIDVSGWNYGQCNVSGWKNIIAIAAGNKHTVGLKADGTVVAIGCNEDGQCNVSDWTGIVAIAAGGEHTVGLKADGTVIATRIKDSSLFNVGQCDVTEWDNIVAIAAGCHYTIGLRADGTVVATGSNYYGQCDVSDWKNIRVPEK